MEHFFSIGALEHFLSVVEFRSIGALEHFWSIFGALECWSVLEALEHWSIGAFFEHWSAGAFLERLWRVREEELEWTHESSPSRVQVESKSKILKARLDSTRSHVCAIACTDFERISFAELRDVSGTDKKIASEEECGSC
jgi:hypothetical protein